MVRYDHKMSNEPTRTPDEMTRHAQGHLSCALCDRRFTRNEHLRRHELTHSDDKPFQCDVCGRGFLRKDARDRHVVTHRAEGLTLRQKGARACANCAVSKSKCSGELPRCLRCQKRGEMECIYPNALASVQPLSHPTSFVTASSQSCTGLPTSTTSSRGTPFMSNDDHFLPSPNSVPVEVNHLGQGHWDSTFQTTINWLTDESLFLSNDFNFDSTNDDPILPFIATLSHETPGVASSNIAQNSLLPIVCHSSNQDSLIVSPQPISDTSAFALGTPVSRASCSSSRQHTEGELYVDGQPARLPRVKRRKLTSSTSTKVPSTKGIFSLKALNDDEHCGCQSILSDQIYHELRVAFSSLCAELSVTDLDVNLSASNSDVLLFRNVFVTAFEPGFPPKATFDYLIHLYITSFQQILPIFHINSIEHLDWQVLLAICSISARFMPSMENQHFASSLHEFVRRVLYIGREKSSLLPGSAAARAHLQLLHAINTTYGSSGPGWLSANIAELLPIWFCSEPLGSQSYVNTELVDIETEWAEWKEREIQIRLRHAIWLVDCMFAVYFHNKPLLDLNNGTLPLPCHEELWHAPSATAWSALRPKFYNTDSIRTALHHLYVQKRLTSSTSEFGKVLLIQGLYHRMWEVRDRYQQPLSQWTPTAAKTQDGPMSQESSVWLPSIPQYSKWRNATCDCIDILHWSANATIGAASGMEHPTVLHLHLSRVVLLVPYRHIEALARCLVGMKPITADLETASCKRTIRRWVMQDQYKARLAMIHAGVLLWHVQRYSTNAFYEPHSVAMAIMALWAFSLFSETPRVDKETLADEPDAIAGNNSSGSEEARCDIILLDRPTDDELVQQYVREGHRMTAILKGVGDLCGEGGPERILLQGKKLIGALKSWGVAERYLTLFDSLIPITCRERRVSSNQGG